MSRKIASVAVDQTGEHPIAKEGKGDRVFLAFLGRARQSEEPPQLSAKSDPVNDLVGLIVLLLFGGMIAVVLWRLLFGAL
jgi:hypothetical protein